MLRAVSNAWGCILDSSAQLPGFEICDTGIPTGTASSVLDAIARFPTTRYYGSKRKLLGWMHSKLVGLRFENALDAFGGTGSVSLLFKAMGKHVTYHDGLRFNEHVGRAVLADSQPRTRDDVAKIFASVTSCQGVVSKNFSGVFFKKSENEWLDGFANSVRKQPLKENDRSLLYYLLFQACMKKRPFNLFHRANLRLRTKRNVERTFGNAATWERSFTHHALQAYDELTKARVRGSLTATILPSGEVEKIGTGYDLVYIDPPYVSREERYNRDNYWRRYHFLEGFSQYEQWAQLINEESDIRIFDAPKSFHEWSQSGSFKERLFSLIDRHRHSIVVLSYVAGAVPSERSITAHFKSRFARVSVYAETHNHALSSKPKRELLFIGHPL